MNTHNGSGRIIYDPHRPGMSRRTEWWAIIQVDRGITEYYRWWINKKWGIEKLHAPSWDAHISIIRGKGDFKGRDPEDWQKKLWKKYQGIVAPFEYDHEPYVKAARKTTDEKPGKFWMVDVRCPIAKKIREELGLKTDWNFHLTVGREYD